jgi:hypothetical protein
MKTREPDPRRRTKKRQMDDIVLSDEGDCATSSECWMASAKKPAKLAWLEWRQLYTSETNRVFFKRGVTYVDAITGSLYRDGRCLTSSRLKLGEIKRNQKGGAAILMAIKGDKNE